MATNNGIKGAGTKANSVCTACHGVPKIVYTIMKGTAQFYPAVNFVNALNWNTNERYWFHIAKVNIAYND